MKAPDKLIRAVSPFGELERISRVLGRTPSFALALVGSYLLLMFVLTHIPLTGSILDRRFFPWHMEGIDKIYHLGSFAVLTILLIVVFAPISLGKRGADFPISRHVRRWRQLGIAVLAYGIVDECSQPLFGRHREILDLAADVGGIALGGLLYLGFVAIRSLWCRKGC